MRQSTDILEHPRLCCPLFPSFQAATYFRMTMLGVTALPMGRVNITHKVPLHPSSAFPPQVEEQPHSFKPG